MPEIPEVSFPGLAAGKLTGLILVASLGAAASKARSSRKAGAAARGRVPASGTCRVSLSACLQATAAGGTCSAPRIVAASAHCAGVQAQADLLTGLSWQQSAATSSARPAPIGDTAPGGSSQGRRKSGRTSRAGGYSGRSSRQQRQRRRAVGAQLSRLSAPPLVEAVPPSFDASRLRREVQAGLLRGSKCRCSRPREPASKPSASLEDSSSAKMSRLRCLLTVEERSKIVALSFDY